MVMPVSLTDIAPPRYASPPDPSFYELPPGGSDYLDRMASLIGRLVPGYGAVTELGTPPGELRRTLRDRSAFVEGTTESVGYDLVLTRETDVAEPDVRKLLSRCLDTARRAVVWVVPGDDGTRLLGPTLTGCLPRSWVEELESRPLSVETLYAALARDCPPNVVSSTAWSVPLVIRDLNAFAASLTDRLGWSGTCWEADLHGHLAEIASDHPFGHAIPVLRRSAVLAWVFE